MEKEIAGMVGGKCNYAEQMPNNGKMECRYTESERKNAAGYYESISSAGSVETSVTVNLSDGQADTQSAIDGQAIDNPIQGYLNNGICVITGY